MKKKISFIIICLSCIGLLTSGCSSSSSTENPLDSLLAKSISLSVKNAKTATINVQVGSLNYGNIGPGQTSAAQTLSGTGDHQVVVDSSNFVVGDSNVVVAIPNLFSTMTLTISDTGFSKL